VLKIADFGFARIMQPQGLAETVCGSPLYMAPEVLSSSKYDIKADLWSVGTILFQMLVGVTPYQGDNYIHLLDNIRKKRWVMPPEIQAKTSEPCMDLLTGLLTKDPKARMDHEAFLVHPFLGLSPEDLAESSTKSSTGGAQGGHNSTASRGDTDDTGSPVMSPAKPSRKPSDGGSPKIGAAQAPRDRSNSSNSQGSSLGRKGISPGLPPRLPPGPQGAPAQGFKLPSNAELPAHLKGLALKREDSCGSDDEFVLIGTPPATPPLRVAWRGAEIDGDGVKLVRQSSMPEGFGDVVGKVDHVVANFLELGDDEQGPREYPLVHATVVMELANAMVQHSPRDGLALYVKSLKLLASAIEESEGEAEEEDSTAIDARRLFLEVFDKAEELANTVPANMQGWTAEAILYECALAMSREAASCELLNDVTMARMRYGTAFVCLKLLRGECAEGDDKKILDALIQEVVRRAREVQALAAAAAHAAQATADSDSDTESSSSPTAAGSSSPPTTLPHVFPFANNMPGELPFGDPVGAFGQ